MPSTHTFRHSFQKAPSFPARLVLTLTLLAFQFAVKAAPAVYTNFPESFETASKPAYAYGTVSLPSGTWALDDALIGSTSDDRKVGSKSVRLQNSGKVTMLSDLYGGAATISILHASYGADTSCTWGLWYSTNSGTSWTQVAANITTASGTLMQTTFTLTVFGTVRFEIRKTGGGRLNIDQVNHCRKHHGLCPL